MMAEWCGMGCEFFEWYDPMFNMLEFYISIIKMVNIIRLLLLLVNFILFDKIK